MAIAKISYYDSGIIRAITAALLGHESMSMCARIISLDQESRTGIIRTINQLADTERITSNKEEVWKMRLLTEYS